MNNASSPQDPSGPEPKGPPIHSGAGKDSLGPGGGFGKDPSLRSGAPEDSPAAGGEIGEEPPPLRARLRRFFVGKPRDIHDRQLFHQISLIPFLAWVGLGADGLSSSAYGPPEAYLSLHGQVYLALLLAIATASTVVIISTAYRWIIQDFPHGGGGYVVATKLLGETPGLVSGCALLVDYVLTITVSIAAAGDALFSFLPPTWHFAKLGFEALMILFLITLNIRGIRESVLALLPIFLLFLATHVILVVGGILMHLGDIPAKTAFVEAGFHSGYHQLGFWGLAILTAHAYSMGAGTYTGIEAVSNGIPMLREPKVQTAQKTMVYIASSLAFMAGGLLVCYVLVGVTEQPGQTLNAVLSGEVFHRLHMGPGWVIATLVSEGALLVVAAQTGFIDGPRILANMAHDGWVPRFFAGVCDRLTAQEGILLVGCSSLAALFYTHGQLYHLVVMYSINVFITFSLSMAGMLRSAVVHRKELPHWRKRAGLFSLGLALCLTILVVTIVVKFTEGGWLTFAITATLVGVCFLIRWHYRKVAGKLAEMNKVLDGLPKIEPAESDELDRSKPTAVVMVGGYSGVGVHTVFGVLRSFGGHFHNMIFVSVGVIDSGVFKGEREMESLRNTTLEALRKYVGLAHQLHLPAAYRYAMGTDPVEELERLCLHISREFPKSTFFAGQVIFQKETWFNRLLHNHTAYTMQRRLQWLGKTVVIFPIRVREGAPA